MFKEKFTKKNLFIGFTILAVSLCLLDVFFSTNEIETEGAVTILMLNKKGGGSGAIIETTQTTSLILTNGHVCDVIINGGFVLLSKNATQKEEYLIQSYQKYSKHDLCIVRTAQPIGKPFHIAHREPRYMEKAKAIGHPSLNPTTVTEGYFSGRKYVQIFTEIKACTEKDLENEELRELCIFLGGVPVFKSYDTQYVTTLIMPGSSGSPVLNSDNNLSNVVFAGSQELSFAYTVPYEYVQDFLNNLPKYPIVQIDGTVDFLTFLKNQEHKQQKRKDAFEKLKTNCSNNKSKFSNNKVFSQICSKFSLTDEMPDYKMAHKGYLFQYNLQNIPFLCEQRNQSFEESFEICAQSCAKFFSELAFKPISEKLKLDIVNTCVNPKVIIE